MHKDSSGFEGNLIRQRHSRRFCLKTCSCRLTMKPSRGECPLTLKRYVHDRRGKFATPNPSSSPAPTSLTFGSKKTDNNNAKQQKRKIEDNSNCSQPLACAQASHPVLKQAGERPALHSPGWNHRCPRSKKRHFFHCTIARLPAAHTFLMAEISRHALTDLSIHLDGDRNHREPAPSSRPPPPNGG